MGLAVPIISAIASAGTTIWATNKQSNAAKDSAATQVASGDKALAVTKQMYDQNQANLQPWLQSGAAANTALSGLMGLGGGTTPAATATTTTATTPLISDPANDQIRQAYQTYLKRDPSMAEIMSQTGNGEFNVTDPRLAKSVENIRYSPEAQQLTNPVSTVAQNQSSYTRMRAPDGTEQNVPALQVPHFSKLGATVVG
jgi:hypothetical protein